jgi:hypothetical protein
MTGTFASFSNESSQPSPSQASKQSFIPSSSLDHYRLFFNRVGLSRSLLIIYFKIISLPKIVMFMMVLDFLKPLYYKLEKSVASKSIPAVHEILNRLTLDKCDDKSDRTTETFDHSLWNTILQTHVDDTGTTINKVAGIHTVDYAGVAADPTFTEYLELLDKAEPTKLSSPEQLAFWMNVYNALCINIIIQFEKTNNVCIESINNLSKDSDTPVWDQVAGTVAGKEVSLNHVEHEQLRKTWDQPALHSCIVCASASCPNLRKEAFVGDKVAAQMDDQMKQWMKNDSKGLVLTTSSGMLGKSQTLTLSRIFLWFQDDFGGSKGVQQFLPQYIEDAAVKEAIANDVKIRFFDYDWNINRATK